MPWCRCVLVREILYISSSFIARTSTSITRICQTIFLFPGENPRLFWSRYYSSKLFIKTWSITCFLLQGSQRSGKTWKAWKRGSFKKKSGKTWKSQGIFVKFLKSQGKVREFFSRVPWIWCFLANLGISIFKFFSCRTQPWWVLQIIMIITKINTLDFCKTDRGVFEERDCIFPTSWKNCS